jgi:hypothetical protein
MSTRAVAVFSSRPTPGSLSFHAGSDFNAMETKKALGGEAAEFAERA